MEGISLINIIESLAIIIIFIIGGKLITIISQKYLKKWAEKTETKLDDIIIDKAKPPLTYVVWFLGIKIALNPLNIESSTLDKIVNSVIVAIIIYLAITVANIVVVGFFEKLAAKTESTLDDALMPIISKSINVGIVLIGFIWILGIWSIDISPILASIGIAGLAIGLAVKDSLANIFGGISLILDKSIKVGDKIKLEDGQVGIVVDVGLRSTKMRTFDNELIIIPNGKLANSKIQNYSQPDLSARIVIDFGVDYSSDVGKVRKVVYDVLKGMDGIMEDPPVEVLFVSMEDFYLKFSARFWVANYNDVWPKKLEAVDRIFKALKENNISIPFPTQEIILKK